MVDNVSFLSAGEPGLGGGEDQPAATRRPDADAVRAADTGVDVVHRAAVAVDLGRAGVVEHDVRAGPPTNEFPAPNRKLTEVSFVLFSNESCPSVDVRKKTTLTSDARNSRLWPSIVATRIAGFVGLTLSFGLTGARVAEEGEGAGGVINPAGQQAAVFEAAECRCEAAAGAAGGG